MRKCLFEDVGVVKLGEHGWRDSYTGEIEIGGAKFNKALEKPHLQSFNLVN